MNLFGIIALVMYLAVIFFVHGKWGRNALKVVGYMRTVLLAAVFFFSLSASSRVQVVWGEVWKRWIVVFLLSEVILWCAFLVSNVYSWYAVDVRNVEEDEKNAM